MKKALIDVEKDVRGESGKVSAKIVGDYMSDPEDLPTELDELYSPVVNQLMVILDRLSMNTLEESVDYIINEAEDHLLEIFKTMLEMRDVYEDGIRRHFEVFRGTGWDKVSDISELANPSVRFHKRKKNMDIYDHIVQIDKKINQGLQAENNAEQAGKNAQLMIELVDAHVKLAREKAATGISKLTYNSESGFDPLGATYTTKLTSIIYMLGSAIHLCDTLKKQKELTKIMLSR